jgi:hypothetical protein
LAKAAKKLRMCKANSFLLGVLPDINRIMVAERKRVDRLASRTQHARRRPPSVLPQQKGDERVYIKKTNFFNVLEEQPVKAGWQCGQQAKDKLHICCSQAHKMTFALN